MIGDEAGPGAHRPSGRGYLPAELTSFVGRHNELSETRRLLRTNRLVTLTGIGGVGKTRLALHAADQVRQRFPDGVWLVELGELSDSSLLSAVVAGALGAGVLPGKSPEDALVDLLADAECLLVLDNCEQIIDAVAALCVRLLRRCRSLHILCTSREALRVGGETVLRVPPLTVPAYGAEPCPAESDAVTLFVERATAAVPGFAWTEQTRGGVADICRRLDGLPLAIELAVGRLPTLAPAQILDRLADRFELLTRSGRGAPSRQQTLRLCVDWSYELCTPAEQQVWSRLAFFAGSIDLEVAAAICGSEHLLDIVTSLMEKSILIREEAGGAPVRFRMLETLREYGQDRAREAGRADETIDRLDRWYTDLAARGRDEFIGPRQLEWLERIEREQPNLRGVLDRCLRNDPGRGLAMANALFPFWNARGLFSEGRYWLDRVLEENVDEASADLANVVYADCFLSGSQGDLDAVAALAARARAIRPANPEPLVHAIVALTEGVAGIFRAELDAVPAHLEESLVVLGGGDAPAALHLSALTMLGFAHELRGEGVRARRRFEEALAITTERGETVYRCYLSWGTAVSLWRGGFDAEATEALREGLRLADAVDHPLLTAGCLEALAWITERKRDSRRAAALLGAAEVLSHRTESAPTFLPGFLVHHRETERALRAALGKSAFDLARRTGAELAASGEVRRLLESAPASPEVIPGPEPSRGPLTRREAQVAALIGRGLTNRAIARELVISERTVHGHVERILAKLNMSSRVQVAAWIAGRQHICTSNRDRAASGLPATEG